MTEKQKIEIGILGGAGLTGKELLHLLSRHPGMRPVHITSDRHAGLTVSQVFPDIPADFGDLVFSSHDDPIQDGIPVFLAVPNETSMSVVPRLMMQGHPIVDLSGSFRLHNRDIFEKYYKLNHTAFHLMEEQVFGLPEIFRSKIPGAKLIANPGCYPTGSILPLFFLGDYRNQIRSIVIDAKSGVSGAGGRVEDAGFSFNSVHENFRAYKILSHQHQPEIQEYSASGLPQGFPFPIVFTPHLLPLYRGILSTIVIHWNENAPENLISFLEERTAREPFVRIMKTPEEVQLSRVQNTNFVDISARSMDNVSVIVSAIDNLQKGAAGQAIQNMNLILGFNETDGLLLRS